jgi:hypothetical protein
VSLPSYYYDWLKTLEFLEFSWADLVVPGGCVPGGFLLRLLLIGLTPIALIVAYFLVTVLYTHLSRSLGSVPLADMSVSVHRRRRRTSAQMQEHTSPLIAGLLKGLPVALLLTFLISTSTCSGIFSAWGT